MQARGAAQCLLPLLPPQGRPVPDGRMAGAIAATCYAEAVVRRLPAARITPAGAAATAPASRLRPLLPASYHLLLHSSYHLLLHSPSPPPPAPVALIASEPMPLPARSVALRGPAVQRWAPSKRRRGGRGNGSARPVGYPCPPLPREGLICGSARCGGRVSRAAGRVRILKGLGDHPAFFVVWRGCALS